MKIMMYGIPNCDTVKKARAWLQERGVAYEFHDFKKQGVPTELLLDWMQSLGWEALLNKKGTTWRKLDARAQNAVVDEQSALKLMQSQPSVIRRPIVQWVGGLSLGFSPEKWIFTGQNE